MTDVAIQKCLTDTFNTLNEFSGKNYLTKDAHGKITNTAYPNSAFNIPADNRFFVLSFLPAAPSMAANFEDAQDRYTGLFQIDVMTPIDKGESEADTKYNWISKLFARGKALCDNNVLVDITKCYRASVETESTYYRTVIRIEWTADIDKQE